VTSSQADNGTSRECPVAYLRPISDWTATVEAGYALARRFNLVGDVATREVEASPSEVAELRTAAERVSRGEVRWIPDDSSVLDVSEANDVR